MDRYITFNPDKFLKEAKGWPKEKKDLQRKLDSILELTAVSNSEIHTNRISDPTSKTAMSKLDVEYEIERIEHYEEVLQYGLSHITEEEERMLKAFYWTRSYINKVVDDFCNELNCSPRQVYKHKRQALDDFADAVSKIL